MLFMCLLWQCTVWQMIWHDDKKSTRESNEQMRIHSKIQPKTHFLILRFERLNECYLLKKQFFTTENFGISLISFNFTLNYIEQPTAIRIIALPEFNPKFFYFDVRFCGYVPVLNRNWSNNLPVFWFGYLLLTVRSHAICSLSQFRFYKRMKKIAETTMSVCISSIRISAKIAL